MHRSQGKGGGPPEPESFRGLLLRHRGRTGLTQPELASRAGIGLRSIQDWEAGTKFPSAELLQALLRALLESNGLIREQERSEAHALWTAVEQHSRRMHTPFDEEWFATLLATRTSVTPVPIATLEAVQDWCDAPDTTGFVGRTDELALLRRWMLEERCRLVTLLGFGGIGKTILAARLAQMVAPDFERVYWRSLRNAPPVADWLAGAISFLSAQQVIPPQSESDRFAALLQLLRARRCLLVLDNSETLFLPGQREGRYRAGMDGYGHLLHGVGVTSHQSCLILTSREEPPELAVLSSGAHSLELHGLGIVDAQLVLADKQLTGDAQAWAELVARYSGNGLALKIVAETIRQVFGGDVASWLRDAIARYGTMFGGIRRLLDLQVERLSCVEYDLLTRLAVEREPISLAKLSAQMAGSVARSTLVEVIETLRRRSLVERGPRGATFTLQSMVLEYMTDRLVEQAVAEISSGQPAVLVEQPLIKAQAKDYVRQTQERLIGAPILQRLNAQDTAPGTEVRLLELLNRWRGRPATEQGYGPGNVVNLLRLLRGDLRGLDLSDLTVRQMYLQGVDAQDASLMRTHLTDTVLDEAFAFASEVALSLDGAVLVAGTPTGELRIWQVENRTLLLAVRAHTGMVWDVAISDDAQLVASGGEDRTLRLWNASSGRLQSTLEGHTAGVRGVALSGDGRVVASASWDGSVRLWDTASGQPLATLRGHTGGVRSVALSTDARLAISGGDDATVRTWDASSGQLLTELPGHIGLIWNVALSGDGRLAASAGEDGKVRFWDVAIGRLLATLQGDAAGVRAMAMSLDGRLVAGGSFAMYRALETTIAQNAQRKTQQLTLPVLAIGGAQSLGPAVADTMKLGAQDVQSLVIPGCGHHPPEETPEELLSALTTFLAPYRSASTAALAQS